MALSCILLLVGLASVYSEPIMLKTLSMNKEMMPEKMLDDPVMVETAMAKPKRDSWGHSTPCPPYLHDHVHKGWQPHPQVQFIHQPTVIQKPLIPIHKPHVPYHQPGWNSGWSNPGWNQGWSKPAWNPGWNQGWSKPAWNPGWNQGWSKPAWNPGWNQGWSKPSHGWHQPIVISKPSHGWPSSYAPQWQSPHLIKPAIVVKPDCPPWQHEHPHHAGHHTGIVYAPQHQSYHEPHIKYLHNEPQYVKVVKPAYHQHPIIPWQPPVHHIPKVELCD